MKKIIKKIKDKYKRKIREKERKPEYFEDRLLELLEFLFIWNDLYEEEIKKKLSMSDEEFESLINLAKRKNYIIKIIVNKPRSGIKYELSPEGSDFVFDFKGIKAQQNSTRWVMMATIVLALSAILTLIITFSALVVPVDTNFCADTIYKNRNYTALFSPEFTNVGRGMASSFRLKIVGEDFIRVDEPGNWVMTSGKSFKLNPKLQMINPEKNNTQISFSGRYYSLRFISLPTKGSICYYEKEKYSEDFKLID